MMTYRPNLRVTITVRVSLVSCYKMPVLFKHIMVFWYMQHLSIWLNW